MPYTHIIYIKLFLNLINGDSRHQFLYELNEEQQSLYCKILLLAGTTQNQIPARLDSMKDFLHITYSDDLLKENLYRIMFVFPHVKTDGKIYYIDNFSELHNLMVPSKKTPKDNQKNTESIPKENQRSTKGIEQSKSKSKSKKKSKSKNRKTKDKDMPEQNSAPVHKGPMESSPKSIITQPAKPLVPQALFWEQFKELYETMTHQPFKKESHQFILIANLLKQFPMKVVVEKTRILAQLCHTSGEWFTKSGWRDFKIETLSKHWNALIPEKTKEQKDSEEWQRIFKKQEDQDVKSIPAT